MAELKNRLAGWGDRRWRLLVGLATVFITGAILVWIIYRQRDLLLSYDWQIRPGYLLLSFGVYSINLWVVAAIWGSILNTLGGRLSLRKHFIYFVLSNAAKRLPGTVWYIASRAQLYHGEGVPVKTTSLASGIEFVINILTSVLISLIFTLRLVMEYRYGLIGVLIVLVVIILILQPAFIYRLLDRFAAGSHSFSYLKLLGWIGAYTIAWLMAGLVLFLIANAFTEFGIEHLGYLIGSLGLVNVITSALFFAPSNLGITELGLSLLLSRVMPASVAVVYVILVRILMILYDIGWAGISLWVMRGWRSSD